MSSAALRAASKMNKIFQIIVVLVWFFLIRRLDATYWQWIGPFKDHSQCEIARTVVSPIEKNLFGEPIQTYAKSECFERL